MPEIRFEQLHSANDALKKRFLQDFRGHGDGPQIVRFFQDFIRISFVPHIFQ